MDSIEYKKIKKILAIYDNFHLKLQKLKDDYFVMIKRDNQAASEQGIGELRKKIRNL